MSLERIIARRLKREMRRPQTAIGQSSPITTAEGANMDDMMEIAVSALPKFIFGHPKLGAIPKNPGANPTWEI